MSKEKILNEYRKKFGLCDGSLKYCGCKKELDFISKAIDQTREETIREIREALPVPERMINFNFFSEKERANKILGFEECLREIKYSLKSLINK